MRFRCEFKTFSSLEQVFLIGLLLLLRVAYHHCVNREGLSKLRKDIVASAVQKWGEEI